MTNFDFPPVIMRTEITLTPVANGWIVSIPSLHNENDQALAMMIKMAKTITGDEVETSEKKPDVTRDNSIFIFDDFEKVLAFLAKQIIKFDKPT